MLGFLLECGVRGKRVMPDAELEISRLRAEVAALTEERDWLRAECEAVKALHERFETEVEDLCTSLEAAFARLEERSAAGAREKVRLREALEQIAHPDQRLLHTSAAVLQEMARAALAGAAIQ